MLDAFDMMMIIKRRKNFQPHHRNFPKNRQCEMLCKKKKARKDVKYFKAFLPLPGEMIYDTIIVIWSDLLHELMSFVLWDKSFSGNLYFVSIKTCKTSCISDT